MARPEFEVPEFVSESDSDQIQERMMGNLPADISDMEGDFPYDFTMPTAIEISQLVQFNLVRCLMVAFPEYSWGDWWRSRSDKKRSCSSNWNSVCYGGLWHSIGSRHSFCSSCNRSDGSC